MSYPGATIKNDVGIKLGQLIAFLQEVAEQEGYDSTLGCPGSGSDDNLYRVKIGGERGGKSFALWMDEGYDSNDQHDLDDGLLIKKKPAAKAKKAKKTAQKATPVITESPSTGTAAPVPAPVPDTVPATVPAPVQVPAPLDEERPYKQYNYMQYVDEIKKQQDRPIADRKGRRACAQKPYDFYNEARKN